MVATTMRHLYLRLHPLKQPHLCRFHGILLRIRAQRGCPSRLCLRWRLRLQGRLCP